MEFFFVEKSAHHVCPYIVGANFKNTTAFVKAYVTLNRKVIVTGWELRTEYLQKFVFLSLFANILLLVLLFCGRRLRLI